jgi:hypothetical protein
MIITTHEYVINDFAEEKLLYSITGTVFIDFTYAAHVLLTCN